MTEAAVAGGQMTAAQLHSEIQLFYAMQMQLLDSGNCEAWARTFTEDGVFAANAYPEPVAGRSDILAAASRSQEALARDGIRHRHWLGMLSVEPAGQAGVRATSYALVIETPRGGQPRLRHSTVCADELVRGEAGWLVRRRQVSRDDLGAA